MKLKIAFFLGIVICLVAAQSSLFAQKEINQSFPGVRKVVLKASSGGCVVRKASNASVSVVLKTNYDGDQYPEYSVVQTGDRLDISEKYHPQSVHGDAPQWTLTVPDNSEIDFKTGSGSLNASDLQVNLSINTGSGDISLVRVNGTVEGITGSGDIVLRQYSGEINATTGSGNVEVENSSGQLKLTSGSGNIRIAESNAAFRSSTGSGNVRGRAITLTGGSSFSTGSGDAEVELAATPQHNLTVGSGSGDAAVNFNGNKLDGKIQLKASKKYGRIASPFKEKIVEIQQAGNGEWILEQTVIRGTSSSRILIETGSGEARFREK